MKKLFAILLAAVMLMIFTGCDNSSTGDNGGDSAPTTDDGARQEQGSGDYIRRIAEADIAAKNIHTTIAAAIGVIESRNDSPPVGNFSIVAGENGWEVGASSEENGPSIAERLNTDIPDFRGRGIVFIYQGAVVAVTWDGNDSGAEMPTYSVGSGWSIENDNRSATLIYGTYPDLLS
jgi:hypothetical protein